MAYAPQPKGKDQKIGNELSEAKKGLSKTEIQAMMKKMMGNTDKEPTHAPEPLMPHIKGGHKRAGFI